MHNTYLNKIYKNNCLNKTNDCDLSKKYELLLLINKQIKNYLFDIQVIYHESDDKGMEINKSNINFYEFIKDLLEEIKINEDNEKAKKYEIESHMKNLKIILKEYEIGSTKIIDN